MCFIFVCRGKLPELSDLASARAANTDGVGIAWFEGRSVHYQKGFWTETEILDRVSDKPFPVVIHFRLGTSGGRRVSLAHPFEIGAEPAMIENVTRNRVLFHNGVVSEWKTLMVVLLPEIIRRYGAIPEGPWSDTMAVALLVSICGESLLELLDGRFLIMDPANRELRFWGDWHDKDPELIMSRPISYTRVKTGIYGLKDDEYFRYQVSGLNYLPSVSTAGQSKLVSRSDDGREEYESAYEVILGETDLEDDQIEDLALECFVNPEKARSKLRSLGFDDFDIEWIIRELPYEFGLEDRKDVN